MAPVNPTVQPTNAPSYGANSRAIDTPDPIRVKGVDQNQIMPHGVQQGDLSAQYEGQAKAYGMQGQALENKSWGDLFSNVVGIGDFLAKGGVHMVKQDIENKVYDVANRTREEYTAELERMKSGGTKDLLDANAQMTDSDIEVPDEVAHLGDSLAALKGAEQAGKITKTDYAGRLLAQAKMLRAQYPGFKKEIDAEFAAVTGMNPANARINGLIQDINKASTNATSEQNKTEAYIMSHENVPGAITALRDFKAGLIDKMEVFRRLAPYAQAKEKMVWNAAEANDKNLGIDDRDRKTKIEANYSLGVSASSLATGLMEHLKIQNLSDVEKKILESENGTFTKDNWSDLNVRAADAITKFKVDGLKYMDATGQTARLKDGKDAAIKIVNAAAEPLEAIHRRIINHDFGGLYEKAQRAKGLIDETKYSMLNDSRIGPALRMDAAFKDFGGEEYLKRMSRERLFGKDNIPDRIKVWYDGMSSAIEVGAAGSKDGVALTFMDAVNEVKAKRADFDDPKVVQAVFGGLVKKMDKITDSTVPDQIKVNLIRAAFSPENRGFIGKLQMDSVVNGRSVSGMNAVFQNWTSEEKSKEIFRLSKDRPELWDMYKDWVGSTFSNDLAKREINDLKDIKDRNIKVGWDSDNKRFVSEYSNLEAMTGRSGKVSGNGTMMMNNAGNSDEYAIVQRSLNRLNSNIYNLRTIADRSGENVDAFVMKTIADGAGKEVLGNVYGIPFQIIHSMNLANQKKQ